MRRILCQSPPARKILTYVLFAFTFHIPVHTAVLSYQSLIYSKGRAAYFRLTTASSVGIHTRPTMQYSTALKKYIVMTEIYLDFLDAGGVLRWDRFILCCQIQKNDRAKRSQDVIFIYFVSPSTDKYTFKPNPTVSWKNKTSVVRSTISSVLIFANGVG